MFKPLKLSGVNSSNQLLQGKPLSERQLKSLIVKSRTSGIISMKEAHQAIRKDFKK